MLASIEDVISDDDTAAFVASPHLATMRDLSLSPVAGGEALARAIEGAPMVETLKGLGLQDCEGTTDGVVAIAKRDTPMLRELDVRGEGVLARETAVGRTAKKRHPKLEMLCIEVSSFRTGSRRRFENSSPDFGTYRCSRTRVHRSPAILRPE